MSAMSLIPKAQRATTPKALRVLLNRAESHVREAAIVGWPALEQSWLREEDAIRSMLAAAARDRQANRGDA